MSKVELGSSTIVSTGTKTLTLNDSSLVPQKIVLFTMDSSTVGGAGYGDTATNFTGDTTYGDVDTVHSLTHYKNVSGVKTKVFEATVPSNAFAVAGEFKLSVTTLSATTKVYFVVFGV